MNYRRFYPFRDSELRIIIFNREDELKKRIDQFTDDEIMANDEGLLADNLFEEFRFLSVEIQDEDESKRKLTPQKITVKNELGRFPGESPYFEVDGVVIDIGVPFDGDELLFRCKASTYSFSIYPEIVIQNGYIYLHYEFQIIKGTEARIMTNFCSQSDHDIQSLRAGISYANKDVQAFNAGLRDLALKLVKAKKEKVSSVQKLSQLLAIPVKQTDFAKTHIQVKRKIQPIAHSYKQEVGYTISDSDYNDILKAIKNIGTAIEQAPSSYKSMSEEDLRNVLLGHLNAFYDVQATGETFRKSGKTDIQIEKENHAAFIAECKIWSGPKGIESAISQLDHYLTWRDCKTALIFFVRRADFLSILDSAKTSLKNQANVRYVKEKDKNEFDCSYSSQATPGQIVNIRCFLFNAEAGISKR